MKKSIFIVPILVIIFILTSCTPNHDADIRVDETFNKTILSPGSPQLLTILPNSSMGSAIGPGGDLYVTQTGQAGSILRIDKKSGEITTFTSGLPGSVVPTGGVTDVAFIDNTAYALVTLVGPFFGDENINGIYRIDGPDSHSLVADIGQFAFDNPPTEFGFDYVLPNGLQFAIQFYQGGFLVTDGHHNRVYHVQLDHATDNGEVTEFKIFDNVVPTGLAVRGNTVYMTETGTSNQSNENSVVVSFNATSETVTNVASGIPFLVDVEFNRGQSLFALSQGTWIGGNDGDSAEPYTGLLVKVNEDGSFITIADELDRPTSLEFIKNTAYIVTLEGAIWTVDNVTGPPFGK